MPSNFKEAVNNVVMDYGIPEEGEIYGTNILDVLRESANDNSLSNKYIYLNFSGLGTNKDGQVDLFGGQRLKLLQLLEGISFGGKQLLLKNTMISFSTARGADSLGDPFIKSLERFGYKVITNRNDFVTMVNDDISKSMTPTSSTTASLGVPVLSMTPSNTQHYSQLGINQSLSPQVFGSQPPSPQVFGSQPPSPQVFGSQPPSPQVLGSQPPVLQTPSTQPFDSQSSSSLQFGFQPRIVRRDSSSMEIEEPYYKDDKMEMDEEY